jgi:hypothetical protein
VPTLDDVYRKFGFAAEAAQLLEAELGTLLFAIDAIDDGLLDRPNPVRAAELLDAINSHTLGKLLKRLKTKNRSLNGLEPLLSKALDERNRLFHSFYRQHNFRRNTDEGRDFMLEDLQSIHELLIDAYKAVSLLSGTDLDSISLDALPTRHLPLE